MVIRQAKARCAGISLSELMLRRLDSRAWGGIGIAFALLLSLAMLSAHPYLSEAHAAAAPQSPNLLNNDPTNSLEQAAAAASAAQADPLTDHPLASSDSSSDPVLSSADAVSSIRSANHSAIPDGTGSAAGRSKDGKNSSLNRFAPHDSAVAVAGSSAAGGQSAAAFAEDQRSATSGSTSATPSQTSSWRSNGWSADQAAAMQEIHSGQIPGSYRDLVRDYFALPPKSPR